MDGMNLHCAWRLELAGRIAEKLKSYKGICAIAVGGSVARGFADPYSDIEILVFWRNLPDEDTRKMIVYDLNADFFYPFNYESGEDNLIANGFRIDLWHMTVETEEDAVKSVMAENQIDLGLSNAMDTIRKCIPLFGEPIVNAWKGKVEAYPRLLAVKNIEESLESIDPSQAELLFYRQNPTLIVEQIVNMQKNIFLILLAANGEFFPTFKWMYVTLERLKAKPENIERRFRDVFACEAREAFDQTAAVLRETLAIVNSLFPEIDTVSLLNRMKSARIAHESPVKINL